MGLPTNTTPTYTLTIPSTNKKVKYRPLLVKEERALLLAQQSEDTDTMIATLQSIVDACTSGSIDASKLATFDIEYMFTQIRARSVGEDVDLIFRCRYCDDENAKTNIKIDVTKIDVQFNPDHSKKIPLFDDVGIVMKYPTFEDIKQLESGDADVDSIFDVLINCIDYIYDSEQIYQSEDTERAELIRFIDNLDSKQFERVKKFFETMPVYQKVVDYTCPVCNSKNSTVLKGIHNFF